MSSTFTLTCDVDIRDLETKLGTAELTRRRMDFADAMADKMEPYVPKKHGDLRDRGNRTIGDGTITYTENYSAAVYVMPDSYNYTTPGTSGHWDEKFAAAEGTWIVEKAEKLLTEGLE